MKKVFFTLALATLVASCSQETKVTRKPGTTKIWLDKDDNRHREFVGDDGSYAHHINGVLVELKRIDAK